MPAVLLCLGEVAGGAPDQASSARASDVIGFRDMAEAREIAQETLAPGGKFAAYVVTIPDVRTNTRREELHLAPADGRGIRRVETPPRSSPSSIQWLPDGQRFAFLLRDGGGSQIYLGDAATGAAAPVAGVAGGVEEYAISPDGARIAFIAPAPAGRQLWTVTLAGSAAPTPVSSAVASTTTLRWHPDGRRVFFVRLDGPSGRPDVDRPTPAVVRWQDPPRRPRHIWSIDVDARQERRWTEGTEFTVLNFQLSPDGRHVAFQTNATDRALAPNDEDQAALRLMSLDGSAARVVVSKLGGPGYTSYAFSPDGRALAFTTNADSDYRRFSHVFSLDLATGRQRAWMESADFSVRTVFWNETSDTLFFAPTVGVNRPWFSLHLSDGSCARISTEQGRHTGRYIPSAGRFISTYESALEPPEVFVATAAHLADRSRWIRVSRANVGLADLPKPSVETIRWKSRDGREIEGMLYKPLGYRHGERYPMVVQTNGLSNSFASNYQSYAPLLASRGYLVFGPQHRGLGSNGYGEAYRRESHYPNQVLELGCQDILSGVEHLVREGVADPERLVLMGWSIGGEMANWLMTRSRVFKAISSGAGTVDKISTYAQIEQYRYYYRNTRGGSAFRVWDRYADSSALKFMGQATTPTLINVGELDDGVVLQCRETYNALREFGVPVEMLIHAGQPHILQTPQSILAKVLAEYYWFEQWARGGPSWLRWRDEFDAIVGAPGDSGGTTQPAR